MAKLYLSWLNYTLPFLNKTSYVCQYLTDILSIHMHMMNIPCMISSLLNKQEDERVSIIAQPIKTQGSLIRETGSKSLHRNT